MEVDDLGCGQKLRIWEVEIEEKETFGGQGTDNVERKRVRENSCSLGSSV